MTRPPALTPFALSRQSPTRFDPHHVVADQDVEILLEAVRRTPSAGNSQPWSFVIGRRDDSVHQRLVRHLAASSAAWAPQASLLVANLAQHLVEDSDMEYSEFARYDLGQAVAHLTFQAHALGLSVRQFRAFDRAGLSREFGVPPHWEVTSMAALGVPLGDGGIADFDTARRPLHEITWARAGN